ncbi:MAG: hypothetical protein ACREFU_11295 [Acetobacteraceae bacterium]
MTSRSESHLLEPCQGEIAALLVTIFENPPPHQGSLKRFQQVGDIRRPGSSEITEEKLEVGLERIALDWNRGAIQERVNPLGQTKESVFSQPEHALASNSRPTPRLLVAHQSLTILGQGKFGLEQYHPDWNRQMPVRVMKLLEKTDIERVQPA